ncbi:MAG: hypothetical protein JRI76_08750 [Deltaproteobacteria bacterium]|nr:hypothetical protein [Deltaproteobacteria bacterium]MBW1956569.1 hypothetical protein [Deltaproteobacteria bacterium]MBW2042108.1 hypothetical protein [Deltaproteobacteria bacterium]MBW2132601.1 hypothetical protein [Deltaproteobacteria bacterium]
MVITDFHHDLDMRRLACFMGAPAQKKKSSMTDSVERRVEGLTDRVDKLAAPRVNFRSERVDCVTKKQVILVNGTSFNSVKLARTLKDASMVFFFIATIGPGLEKEIARIMEKGRYADAYVLDVMASLTVEDVVDQFHRRMASRFARNGKSVTRRFSPGYCDLPLPEQKKIFDQFDKENTLGVQLSDAFLMMPRKSVSGVFGVLDHPAESPEAAYNPCDHCAKADCIARR